MEPKTARQQVWDLPTRLFHWVLVVLFGFSWWSAETHHMDWHQYSGIAVFGLLAFRLLWGVVGADTARFTQFVKGPRKVLAYLRPGAGNTEPHHLGHNPLGGWSVLTLLVLLCLQVIAGLFAVDVDGIESGPLSYLVNFDQGRIASAVHKTIFDVLLVMVSLHVAAILFYLLVKNRNLTRAMVTGSNPTDTDAIVVSARLASPWTLITVLVVVGLVTYGVAIGFRF